MLVISFSQLQEVVRTSGLMRELPSSKQHLTEARGQEIYISYFNDVCHDYVFYIDIQYLQSYVYTDSLIHYKTHMNFCFYSVTV